LAAPVPSNLEPGATGINFALTIKSPKNLERYEYNN